MAKLGFHTGALKARPQQSEDTGDPRNGRAWGPGTEELPVFLAWWGPSAKTPSGESPRLSEPGV